MSDTGSHQTDIINQYHEENKDLRTRREELAERTKDYQEQYQAACDANGRAEKAEAALREAVAMAWSEAAQWHIDHWICLKGSAQTMTHRECAEYFKAKAAVARGNK